MTVGFCVRAVVVASVEVTVGADVGIRVGDPVGVSALPVGAIVTSSGTGSPSKPPT